MMTLARLGKVENDARQALSRAGAGSTLARALEYSFVYRPGGVAGGSVFTTWPTLMAAVALAQGPKLIEVDASLAPAHVPAGLWNLNDVGFTANMLDTLVLDNGAVFVATGTFSIDVNVTLESESAAAIVTVAPGTTVLLYAANGASWVSDAGAAPFFHVPAGATLDATFYTGAFAGDGVHHVFQVDAGGTLNSNSFGGGGMEPNAVAGAGAWNLALGADGFNGQPQGIAPTITIFGEAAQCEYVPNNVAHWSGVAPTSVANALDRIAAKITPIP